jgi:hypothetical protein
MEHYVTLFDSAFLPQGLALIDSLERHAGQYALWVLCVDDQARRVLNERRNPNVHTIALADVETPELLAVKAGRTRAEYCWTLTPWTPRFVFEREPTARRVTYLDADLFLLGSPQPIFDELDESGKDVLITEHAYDPEYDQSASSGRFCVQLIVFTRDGGESVREDWARRCLEWCFNRVEPGRFGDQKYLDDWPERFADRVHVLRRVQSFQAPWNARRFSHREAIAWHFHGLRIEGRRIRWYLGYEIPDAVEEEIYGPYVGLLEAKLQELGGRVYQGPRRSPAAAWITGTRYAIEAALGISPRFRHRKVTVIRR